MYNSRARAAFRSVQPFVNLEAAQNLGVAMDQTFEESFLWSELHRVDTLWNIDKHRRLTLMAWWPDLIHWSSNGPSNRQAFPGDGTLADGSILLYIEGADDGQSDELRHEFNLVLTDDPAFSAAMESPTMSSMYWSSGASTSSIWLSSPEYSRSCRRQKRTPNGDSSWAERQVWHCS